MKRHTYTPQRYLTNQKGFALVLSLLMLLIMSILGAMTMNSSVLESMVSGNYRTNQVAFDTAQRAVEYSATNGDIYTNLGPGSVAHDLDTNAADQNNINAGTGWGLAGTDNYVAYQLTTNLPPGSGSDPTYFEARYYIINVTGAGPDNARQRIEAQYGRIVPK
jgi:Tfp pilus assembly protein PilX